jgi:hypothetical protein
MSTEQALNDSFDLLAKTALKVKAERDALREALREAINTIQLFYGPGWETYRDYSPNMKHWKKLLDGETT